MLNSKSLEPYRKLINSKFVPKHEYAYVSEIKENLSPSSEGNLKRSRSNNTFSLPSRRETTKQYGSGVLIPAGSSYDLGSINSFVKEEYYVQPLSFD